MALFNQKTKAKNKTVNYAGGQAFTQSPEMQLISMLLTSFAKNQFYRDQKQTFDELIALLEKVNPLFAAKAAIFARTEFGMRSITHILAAHLASKASGQDWAKRFYEKVIFRPDDMMEILACYYGVNQHTKMPNAMKKGFAKAFNKFDAYQLAKYRGANKSVKLVDLVNLVHPTPTEKNAKALKALVADTLRSQNTWESKLTQAGQKADNKAEKAKMKAKAWADLLSERKLGYFALLRNLRNIAEQAPELIGDACQMLTNRKLIEKSLVLPFRFLSAMEAVADIDQNLVGKLKNALKGKASIGRQLQTALNTAIDLSLANVPQFEGRTLVVLDDSGSMTYTHNSKGKNQRPIDIGALFAAVLYKSNNADLMCFSDDARYKNFNIGDATQSIQARLVKGAKSGGTNFHAIFQKAKMAYDRIIILSDMQGWVGHYAPTSSFADYKQRTGANPFIYSFDLQGYGTLQFPENKVFAIAGFSEKIFELMALLETDPHALKHKVEAVEI